MTFSMSSAADLLYDENKSGNIIIEGLVSISNKRDILEQRPVDSSKASDCVKRRKFSLLLIQMISSFYS